MTANIFYPVIPAVSLVRYRSSMCLIRTPGKPTLTSTPPPRSQDLKVSAEQVNLSVTWYMLLQGLAPSLWGSICDVLGRRPVYMVTFSMCGLCIASLQELTPYLSYIAACIGLANTNEYWLLVLLRCVQATGSASTIAIGAG